jgi:nicotinamidase-related amidase
MTVLLFSFVGCTTGPRISKIILGGMLANMCVESHLRELVEQGFEVAVVKDAAAGPKHPEWGYGYCCAD